MNGFLVVARFTMDDAPLRLLPRRKEALDYINSIDEYEAQEMAFQLLGVDISYAATCVGVVEFTDGVPSPFELVRDFELEEVGG